MEKLIKQVFGNEYLLSSANYQTGITVLWLGLGLVGLVLLLVVPFLLIRKNKGQRVYLMVLSVIMLLLQIGRIVWQVVVIKPASLDLTWFLQTLSLHVFSLMTWITAITTIVIAGKKTRGKISHFFMNVMLGVGVVVALLSFINPVFLNETRSLYHFENLSVMLIRGIIIAIPIYMVSKGWNTIRFKNIWQPVLVTVVFVGIALLGTEVLVKTNSAYTNFFFMQEIPKVFPNLISSTLASDINANLWSRAVTAGGVFILGTVILYGVLRPFELLRKDQVLEVIEKKVVSEVVQPPKETIMATKPEKQVTSAIETKQDEPIVQPFQEDVIPVQKVVSEQPQVIKETSVEVKPSQSEEIITETTLEEKSPVKEAVIQPREVPVTRTKPLETKEVFISNQIQATEPVEVIVLPTNQNKPMEKTIIIEQHVVDTPATGKKIPTSKDQWLRRAQLETLVLVDLRNLAKEYGMTGYYNVKKSTLVDEIMEYEYPVLIPREPLETKILTRSDLESLVVVDLKELAKTRGVIGSYKMNRSDLIRELVKISKAD